MNPSASVRQPAVNAPTGKQPADTIAEAKNRQRISLWFLAALIVLGAWVAYAKSGPKSASASTVPGPATSVADLSVASASIFARETDRSLDGAEKLAGQFSFTPAQVQVPLMELKINPFSLSAAGFSQNADVDGVADTQRVEQERQSALVAIQSLQLQSIRRGGTIRECIINGTRYQEGQEANGFYVEEIAADTVVVRKGVYRFELKLVR